MDQSSQENNPTQSENKTSQMPHQPDLEQLARNLAGDHKISNQMDKKPWLTVLLDTYKVLLDGSYQHFRSSSEKDLALSYAAEWILDNHFVIRQTLRQISEDLPSGYYLQLPKLVNGPLAGYPRVYSLACQIILSSRAHLETDDILRFVMAYQSLAPLTMGEIWALPIMLRFGLIESLVLASGRITGTWKGDDHPLPLLDLSTRISDDEVIGAAIISLRTLAVQDWQEFFESLSLVDRILSKDPAGVYERMDFQTRDRYRKVIEELAQGSIHQKPQSQDVGLQELEVARVTIQMAKANHQFEMMPDQLAGGLNVGTGTNQAIPYLGFIAPRQSHIGYYLVDRGLSDLERTIGYRPVWYKKVERWVLSRPTFLYLGCISLLSMLIWLSLILFSRNVGATQVQMIVVGALLLMPALTISTSLTNWLITKRVKPRQLPKMDFENGIPQDCATMVVIPTLLSNLEDVKTLLHQLKLHYLRNQDENIFFGLLTDFNDAPHKDMPDDEQFLTATLKGINELNLTHTDRSVTPFYLFHRERRWNPREERWMGWERKRGKLHEFNRFLLSREDTSITVKIGDLENLPPIKYVITLDTDTLLPMDSARRLIGTIAHPLNQAEFDPNSGAVVAGYTVLQPRTEIHPVSANRSIFTRVYSGDTGLDLYTLAVSDVYQDLFGEGIYVGKGIYDVDAFERSLKRVVPENAILSHDLFEGIHGRVGLVTDIVLIEHYPPNYFVRVQRTHRWARGDWQLLPWLFPRVPSNSGDMIPNRLSLIDRWKILDNLRRSLEAPAFLVLILVGWFWLPVALVWMLVSVVALGTSFFTGILDAIIQVIQRDSLGQRLHSLKDSALRWLLAVVFLPYEALTMIDAIAISFYRMFFSKKHLLRWTTAAQASYLFSDNLRNRLTRREMLFSFILTAGLGLLIWQINPAELLVASPLLLAWLFSPEVAYLISKLVQQKPSPLTLRQRRRLRNLARRTWMYFERFVGPEDHWLAPDHYQESPLGTVAHRTSPTNIGLALLSTLAAFDLGYVGTLDLVARLRSILDNMSGLERYRGHFLNWYDTRTLDPLPPRYVSTVDSGNLAACLIILGVSCQQMLAHQPVFRWETWVGLIDLINLLQDLLNDLIETDARAEATSLHDYLEQTIHKVLAVRDKPNAWPSLLEQMLVEIMPEIEKRLLRLVENFSHVMKPNHLEQLRIFTKRLRYHRDNTIREVKMLLPWLFSINMEVDALFSKLSQGEGVGEKIQHGWKRISDSFPIAANLNDIRVVCKNAKTELAVLRDLLADPSSLNYLPSDLVLEARGWIDQFDQDLESANLAARLLEIGFQELHQLADQFLDEMDFGFLFHQTRQVFHIGYNVTLEKHDNNFYDLLASEARIASIIAIAKGDVPQSHWLHLARPFTKVDGTAVLLSWSATMFEYLMPLLFQRSIEGTLLHQSSLAAIQHQYEYGAKKNLPWGISESGYYHFDSNQFYQYRAFGVPGLGYKRGLREDLVISPYASVLALPFRPEIVSDNIEHLASYGMIGTYGLYESIDFTAARMPLGEKYRIVRSYMVHHQGMIMLSMANYFKDNIMVRRFHGDARIQSVDLLLQELTPGDVPYEFPHTEESLVVRPTKPKVVAEPWRIPEQTPQPRAHFLSNGRLGVQITSSGGGYVTWDEIDLTRWRADTTLNDWGTWVYIQDMDHLADGVPMLWSSTIQPVGVLPDHQDIHFDAHMAQFHRSDRDISVSTEVTVAPNEDVEIRRLTLTNHGNLPRRLRLTSYGEVILAPQAEDERHPMFNRLFIESEWVPELNALIFRRRPRKDDEDPVYLAHSVVVPVGMEASATYESDRGSFIGRGRTARTPQALTNRETPDSKSWLSGKSGATLDPIMAIGQEVVLERFGSAQIAFLTIPCKTRQKAIEVCERFQVWRMVELAFDQARSKAELELRQLGIKAEQLPTFQDLISVLIYPHMALRATPEILVTNRMSQPDLWAYGISGDYPILLVKIHKVEELPLAQELFQAFAFWRRRGLKIDLVILNMQGSDYGQVLSNHLHRLMLRLKVDAWLKRRGGIFLLHIDQLGDERLRLLETVSRAILEGDRGLLKEQIKLLDVMPQRLPSFSPSLPQTVEQQEIPPVARPDDLLFDNGLGGFSSDGREYQIYLEPGQITPAPWINVVANQDFGFLVSESGSSYTWAENSGENRLTPWSNDPVSDKSGEALYLRDEETSEVWTPTPLPAGAKVPFLICHSAGYSTFEHKSFEFHHQLRLFIAPDNPVKIIQLRLENLSNRPRRITATYYAEWVLGSMREANQQYIVPEFDHERQAILVRNPYNQEFGERVAFLAASKDLHGLTADRNEFLGNFGDYRDPAALRRIGLASTVHAGLDPCAAVQLHMDLEPGAVEEIYFLLGQADNYENAIDLISLYKEPENVATAFQASNKFWDEILGAVQVSTPEPAMDLLLNRWLLYQSLACRIWGRSAFYQSSGAYGFRDQLQDVMSLIHVRPDLARKHLLRSARHQFEEGDVLHWWHPPSGRGVRSRYSDDLLWLPYATMHYVDATNDKAMLSEQVPFLKGAVLKPDEKERYGFFSSTSKSFTLYEHCRRALQKGMTSGDHNLPLIAGGDWNDGMNRVGAGGRGESVWLGWFSYDILNRFADFSLRMDDPDSAQLFTDQARQLQQALEKHAWDGDWYLRAFYDDGTPLGSANSQECQIDSLSQSWSVLSQAGQPERVERAMKSVYQRLVLADEGLILLFTQPFDKTPLDPGYIKGYPPGIRENGGQYTHAALWVIWAYTRMGKGDIAENLFRLINPIYHTDTPAKVQRYRVEPYVIAADVYGHPPHTGRGGWTWYTGSSGWMYRLGIEAILGLRREGQNLVIDPCIPSEWNGFTITYRYQGSLYHIQVDNPQGVCRGVGEVRVNGEVILDGRIPLEQDSGEQQVTILMGSGS
jgi:cyclic beta-1,2-glucan synthetase